jgi:hypothetical protein
MITPMTNSNDDNNTTTSFYKACYRTPKKTRPTNLLLADIIFLLLSEQTTTKTLLPTVLLLLPSFQALQSNLPLEKDEQLAEFQSYRKLQLKYGELSLLKFWMLAKEKYPEIAVEAVNTLLQFSTTYLYELGFSALTNTKNKKREGLLSLEQEMHVCLSSIRPRIELLYKKRQAQDSH